MGPDFMLMESPVQVEQDSDTFQVIKKEALPNHISAQEAELTALLEACKALKGMSGNIYMEQEVCL